MPSQNLFRRVVLKAESRGMVVNRSKTKILCVSDAQTYKARVHIYDSEGNKLESGSHLKVLGFHMDSRPSAHAHVQAMRLRMRDTVWILPHLKITGFSEPELATVYRTIIRPILDSCAVVYHPMLTDEQDQIVERMQAQALKCIYGYTNSYAVMREKAGVTTHRARRTSCVTNSLRRHQKTQIPGVVPSQDRQVWATWRGVPGPAVQLPAVLLPMPSEWEAWEDLWTEEQEV